MQSQAADQSMPSAVTMVNSMASALELLQTKILAFSAIFVAALAAYGLG
eukprot:CAMPEP_0194060440 /NCGR_PEP_ID=MMETSP0009_2-20130614/71754_1 /TAXON_ID=210454 /ORGANISM="Grammatophora oceanica, Strain CCMP 410" /LENGTH=48 /DNA_ID= /DNA_START= /DNA_END= /DNA_ORIENTATION=